MFTEWDDDKAQSNLIKHGVSFEEAATVFEDPVAITFNDQEHSETEERFVTIGYSAQLRALLVINTEREDNIRIISARKTTPSERKLYDQQL